MEEPKNSDNSTGEYVGAEDFVSKTYIQKCLPTENGIKIVRANLLTDEDAHRWISEFSAATNTHWIVGVQRPHPEKSIFRKRWECYRSNKNKKVPGKTLKSETCQAYVSIKIKKYNRSTRRNDHYLCCDPPLQGLITLNLRHSHPMDDTPSYLRINEDVRKIYEEAFENNLSPPDAHSQYIKTLALRENSAKLLADRRINPVLYSVRNIYDLWRKKKYGDKATLTQDIRNRVEYYQNQGIDIIWTAGTDEKPWVVLLVTAFMKENQSVETCADFVHVVTTTSGTATLLTSPATIFFGDSPAGVAPLAVIIHETLDISAFKTGFQFLKENFPRCFGGKNFPTCFMTDNISAQKQALNDTWPHSDQLICHLRLLKSEWRYLTSIKMGVPLDKRKPYFNCFNRVMYAESEANLSAAEFLFCDSVTHPGFRERIQNLLSENLREEWIQLHRSNLTRGPRINNFAIAVILAVKRFSPRRTKSFSPVELMDSAVSEWGDSFEVTNETYKPGKRDIWGEMPVDFDDGLQTDFKYRPVLFKRGLGRKGQVKSRYKRVRVDKLTHRYEDADEDPVDGDDCFGMDLEVPSHEQDYRGADGGNGECLEVPSHEEDCVADGGNGECLEVPSHEECVADGGNGECLEVPSHEEDCVADGGNGECLGVPSHEEDCVADGGNDECLEVPIHEEGYQIVAKVENCGCRESLRGEVCEHQAAGLQEQLGRLFTNAPASCGGGRGSEAGRITLMAMDQKESTASLILDTGTNIILLESVGIATTQERYTSQIDVEINATVEPQESVTEERFLNTENKAVLLEEITRILDLADSSVVENHCSSFLQSLKDIRTRDSATNAFLRLSSAVKRRRIN